VPYKPKKPCAYPGCPKLTATRYCDEHNSKSNFEYNHYQRDPETNKRYGSRWKQIRNAFLKAHPLCEICNESGRLTAATLVHHKQKLTDGGTNEWSNLTPLCQPCHSRLHAKNGDRF
jgi:5-methylcytosine-specific restriction protein A